MLHLLYMRMRFCRFSWGEAINFDTMLARSPVERPSRWCARHRGHTRTHKSQAAHISAGCTDAAGCISYKCTRCWLVLKTSQQETPVLTVHP